MTQRPIVTVVLSRRYTEPMGKQKRLQIWVFCGAIKKEHAPGINPRKVCGFGLEVRK
jgi:hypothetical protein